MAALGVSPGHLLLLIILLEPDHLTEANIYTNDLTLREPEHEVQERSQKPGKTPSGVTAEPYRDGVTKVISSVTLNSPLFLINQIIGLLLEVYMFDSISQRYTI